MQLKDKEFRRLLWTVLVGLLGTGMTLAASETRPKAARATPSGSGLVMMAQNEAGSSPNIVPSLGTVARKLRDQRETQGTKEVKVYTNDTIPQHGGLGLTVAGAASKSAAEKSSPAAASSHKAAKHGEAYFRKRADKIRSDLSLHKRELAVLEQQLAQAQITYYPNPQETLMQESSPSFQSKANKLRQEIQSKKAQIAADEKAMQELGQELQRDGGDPGWIR